MKSQDWSHLDMIPHPPASIPLLTYHLRYTLNGVWPGYRNILYLGTQGVRDYSACYIGSKLNLEIRSQKTSGENRNCQIPPPIPPPCAGFNNKTIEFLEKQQQIIGFSRHCPTPGNTDVLFDCPIGFVDSLVSYKRKPSTKTPIRNIVKIHTPKYFVKKLKPEGGSS